MTTINFSKLNSNEINQDETFDPCSKLYISLIGKPIEIGHFSIDSNKRMHFDKRQMKYLLSDLKIGELDLNADYSPGLLQQYVTIEKLHTLLKWILHFKVKLNVDFVTVRGTLSRIMCTPYSSKTYRNNWDICATKLNGIIYLTAVDTDKEIARIDEFPQLVRYMSWGYKFEQYLTTAQVDGEVDLTSRNNHEEYCIVLKNKFNDFSLLYQAEIDAVIPHQFSQTGSGDTSCYIELKTSQILKRTTDVFNFCSGKLNTWWAQSYLTGITEIICGRRNENGIVKYLDFYKISDIQDMAYGLWSPEVCLNFCDKFLKLVKRTATEDNPNIVYKFSYTGDGIVHIEKLANPEDKYKVLPGWYKTAME
ncbi:decapping and exoribonuclease protein [Parasteatoda tepidariorum]|nr:decapping and exoribonuclease protein [Parasteatoda tepidariorum]